MCEKLVFIIVDMLFYLSCWCYFAHMLSDYIILERELFLVWWTLFCFCFQQQFLLVILFINNVLKTYFLDVALFCWYCTVIRHCAEMERGEGGYCFLCLFVCLSVSTWVHPIKNIQNDSIDRQTDKHTCTNIIPHPSFEGHG